MISTLFVWIFLLVIAEEVTCETDPCTTSTMVNDTTMMDNYLLEFPQCRSLNRGWYRFTANGDGIMATSCPKGLQCGTDNQLWMDDQIPSFKDGVTRVKICIRGQGDCCSRSTKMEMKNCNSFVVYYHPGVPNRCINYCFNATSHQLVTVATTTKKQSRSTLTTKKGISSTLLVSVSPLKTRISSRHTTTGSHHRAMTTTMATTMTTGVTTSKSTLPGTSTNVTQNLGSEDTDDSWDKSKIVILEACLISVIAVALIGIVIIGIFMWKRNNSFRFEESVPDLRSRGEANTKFNSKQLYQ